MLDEQRDARQSYAVSSAAELAQWRATCRRQAAVIEALTGVVGRLRGGLTALKAENAELRTGYRERSERPTGPDAAMIERAPSVRARIVLGVHAPARARRLVTRLLAQHVTPEQLERAQLAVCELVTAMPQADVPAQQEATIVVTLTRDHLRVQVEAPGGGTVAVPATDTPAGLGSQAIRSLSERWGTECFANGSVRSWADLSLNAKRPQIEDPAATRFGHGVPRTDQPRQDDAATTSPSRRPREVHVMPLAHAGTWALFVDATAGPLSEHATPTAAEIAARSEALRRGYEQIVIHDLYHRTRATTLAMRT